MQRQNTNKDMLNPYTKTVQASMIQQGATYAQTINFNEPDHMLGAIA